jgi:hypothetical protein
MNGYATGDAPAAAPAEAAMLVKELHPVELINPVAILDKEIRNISSFRIEIFELCTVCGARFGIGYFGPSREDLRPAEEIEELDRRLIEILTADHRRQREHKGRIELDA